MPERTEPMEMTGKVNFNFHGATKSPKFADTPRQLHWILLHPHMMNWTPPSKLVPYWSKVVQGWKRFIVSFGC
jgi:hypothetical protein